MIKEKVDDYIGYAFSNYIFWILRELWQTLSLNQSWETKTFVLKQSGRIIIQFSMKLLQEIGHLRLFLKYGIDKKSKLTLELLYAK